MGATCLLDSDCFAWQRLSFHSQFAFELHTLSVLPKLQEEILWPGACLLGDFLFLDVRLDVRFLVVRLEPFLDEVRLVVFLEALILRTS